MSEPHFKETRTQQVPAETELRQLYPEIEPFNTGRLRVSDIHEIYYEEVGNPNGKPAVIVHGGPGGGCVPEYRRFHDPAKYRVVLFDQRGCGRSTPHAELEQNTTWDLVADMERIRELLGIEKWQVFGGSWGSTLSLAYAETHPERVTELVLRGIFLLRKKEIQWFYQEGASYIFPDVWEPYLNAIPEEERGDLLTAYYKRLTGSDPEERLRAAKAWSIWEGSTSRLFNKTNKLSKFEADDFALAFARIECHYFYNNGFFSTEGKGQLLNDAHKISHIPGVIVQGRYDVVCPMYSAWDLHKEWPKGELTVVTDAGHSFMEPGILSELVKATDRFAV